MTQRLSVTDEIDGDEGTIWMPVQVAGEWLWKRISLDSLAENIRTIVVPAGQSFRIVDNVLSPALSVTVNNRDSEGFAGQDAVAYEISCGEFSSGTEPTSVIYGYIVPDAESDGYRTTYSAMEVSDGLGKTASISFGIEPGFPSVAAISADAVKMNLQTYADNAAALAAGLQVGADYNTPAGVRMVVLPPS